jgi:hypothetical protein
VRSRSPAAWLQANGDVEGLLERKDGTHFSPGVLEALVAIGEPAVDHLVAMLPDESRHKDVCFALNAFGEQGVDAVVIALGNSKAAMRKGALRALWMFAGYHDTPRAFTEIRRVAADDADADVRSTAQSLSRQLDEIVSERRAEVNRVLDAMEGSDTALRRDVRALRRGWHYPEVRLLIAMAPKREAAKDALVLMGPAVIGFVVEAMRGSDRDITKAMAHTLMLMDYNGVPAAAALRQAPSEYSTLWDWFNKD